MLNKSLTSIKQNLNKKLIKMAIPTKYIEELSIHDLLETIQANMTINIDSFYNEAIELIGTEKEHNLGWKKYSIKKQLAEYLKTVVKNITHQLLYYNVEIVLKNLLEAIKSE